MSNNIYYRHAHFVNYKKKKSYGNYINIISITDDPYVTKLAKIPHTCNSPEASSGKAIV